MRTHPPAGCPAACPRRVPVWVRIWARGYLPNAETKMTQPHLRRNRAVLRRRAEVASFTTHSEWVYACSVHICDSKDLRGYGTTPSYCGQKKPPVSGAAWSGGRRALLRDPICPFASQVLGGLDREAHLLGLCFVDEVPNA